MFILQKKSIQIEERTVPLKTYASMKNLSHATVRRRIKAGILRIKRDVPRGRIEVVLVSQI